MVIYKFFFVLMYQPTINLFSQNIIVILIT